MAADTTQDRRWITATPEVLDGRPRIRGRRLGVHFLATQVSAEGQEPAAIAARYELPVKAVNAAVEYYQSHSDEMARINREREQLLDTAYNDPATPTSPEELAQMSTGARSASD
jgi:uncharacterized protein (DUF433 family)